MSHIYLAGPVDFSTALGRQKVEHVRQRLTDGGASVFSPAGAWHGTNGTHASAVADINEHALRSAAVLFACYVGPTVGVAVELQIAREAGIPAVVLCDRVFIDSLMLRHLASAGIYEEDNAAQAVARALELAAGHTKTATLQVARQSESLGLPLPQQVHAGDIGMDLYVSQDTVVPASGWCNVPSGIRVAPPPDTWLLILGRSSAIQRRGLVVVPGVIDSGYRGLLYAVCHNLTGQEVTIQRGERLAQLIPLPLTALRSMEVGDLPASERGQRGFGSTGG